MITLVCQALDRGATKYLYLHSDALKRNKAFVRSIAFNKEIDMEEYSDPTAA